MISSKERKSFVQDRLLHILFLSKKMSGRPCFAFFTKSVTYFLLWPPPVSPLADLGHPRSFPDKTFFLLCFLWSWTYFHKYSILNQNFWSSLFVSSTRDETISCCVPSLICFGCFTSSHIEYFAWITIITENLKIKSFHALGSSEGSTFDRYCFSHVQLFELFWSWTHFHKYCILIITCAVVWGACDRSIDWVSNWAPSLKVAKLEINISHGFSQRPNLGENCKPLSFSLRLASPQLMISLIF